MGDMIVLDEKRQKNDKLLLLLTIIIVFITDSLFFAINIQSSVQLFKRTSVIALAVLMFVYHIVIRKRLVNIHILLITVSALLSSFLAGYLFNGYYYYTFIACGWIGYIYSRYYSIEDFSSAFCKIMRVVAVLSFIVFLVGGSLADSGIFPIITSSKGNQYAFLGFTNIPMTLHHRTRNYGPFWEPGTYQIYLNIALYLALFVEKKNNKVIDSIIFVGTGLSTRSGIVLIPMLLILAAYTFEIRNIKTFVAILALIVGIYIIIWLGLFDRALAKITNEDGTNSLIYRWIGLVGGLQGFLRNPLFGSPPSVNDDLKMQLAQLYLGSNYSSAVNTFANLLGYFGAYIGGYFLVSSYKVFSSVNRQKMSAVIAFIAFVLATSNENMTTSLFFIVFCFLRSNKQRNEDNTQKVVNRGA